MTIDTKTLFLTALASIGIGVGHAEAGLVAQYTFDNADIVGSVGAGDSAGSADATPSGTNGGTGITTGQAGLFGQAYEFDFVNGTNGDATSVESLLTAPAGTAPSGSAERTIMTFFNFSATNLQNKIFGYGATSAGSTQPRALALGFNADQTLLEVRNGAGNIGYTTNSPGLGGDDDGWHHVALRVNAGASTFADIDVFLDGVQLNPTNPSDADLADALNTTDTVFGIGADFLFANNGFNGLLDDFRIYDNALSDQDIASLAVPEPSSLALLAMGGLLVARRRRG